MLLMALEMTFSFDSLTMSIRMKTFKGWASSGKPLRSTVCSRLWGEPWAQLLVGRTI